MTEELKDAVRGALKDVQDLIRVARDGHVEYRLTQAVECVSDAVAPLIDAERSSRQAWAEEALRLQDELDTINQPLLWEIPHPFEHGSHSHMDSCRLCGAEAWLEIHQPQELEPLPQVCVCVSDEQAAQLGSGFTRPQCTVHPDGGAA